MSEQFRVMQIGGLYSPDRTVWEERAEYNYRASGHELRIFFKNPADHEIAAVQSGTAEFGLYYSNHPSSPVLIFLYHFAGGMTPLGDNRIELHSGGIPWSDAPYTYWMVNPEDRGVPNREPGDPRTHDVLHVFLVDADTGIIKAMRMCTFSPKFTDAIHFAIKDQASKSFKQAEYDAQLAHLYNTQPTETLLQQALVRCHGGD